MSLPWTIVQRQSTFGRDTLLQRATSQRKQLSQQKQFTQLLFIYAIFCKQQPQLVELSIQSHLLSCVGGQGEDHTSRIRKALMETLDAMETESDEEATEATEKKENLRREMEKAYQAEAALSQSALSPAFPSAELAAVAPTAETAVRNPALSGRDSATFHFFFLPGKTILKKI